MPYRDSTLGLHPGQLSGCPMPFLPTLTGGRMFLRRGLLSLLVAACLFVPTARANDEIPKAAWKRPIGKPLENAGTKKPALDGGHIDDGFWQGAPVGGFGAGTFSRTFRGDFARWHMQAGVHKYQTV